MRKPPPPAAYRLAEKYHLGEPSMAYDNNFKQMVRSTVIMSIVWIITGIGMPLFYLAQMDFANNEIVGISMSLFVIGCCWLIRVLPLIFTRHICVYLCEQGLVYIDKKGVEHVALWKEIEGVTDDTIVRKDGSKIVLHRHINYLHFVTMRIGLHLRKGRKPLHGVDGL